MPLSRRAFAVPAWTERAALLFIAVWTLGFALARALEAVNAAGAHFLPPIPTGPNSWRPAQPLGNIPFDVGVPVSLAAPLLLLAFVLLGFAMWGEPAKRRRFLVMFALVDFVVLFAAFQAVTLSRPMPEWWSYASYQISVAPFLVLVVALAWSSRAGRVLALAAAALTALQFGIVWGIKDGFAAGSFWSSELRFGLLVVAMWAARALAAILMATAIFVAARQAPSSPPSPGSPASGAADLATRTR